MLWWQVTNVLSEAAEIVSLFSLNAIWHFSIKTDSKNGLTKSTVPYIKQPMWNQPQKLIFSPHNSQISQCKAS